MWILTNILYLWINLKDFIKVFIVNESFLRKDSTLVINWFAWEKAEINLSQNWESVMKIVADKKGSKYNISITIPNRGELSWTISPKLSKSSIKIGFDLKLTIKSEEEWWKDTVIPFKGSWKYDAISEFTTTAPENAQDLGELLSSYLWWAMWWDDYDYEYDEAYDYEDLYNNEELEDIDMEGYAEPVESLEEVAE